MTDPVAQPALELCLCRCGQVIIYIYTHRHTHRHKHRWKRTMIKYSIALLCFLLAKWRQFSSWGKGFSHTAIHSKIVYNTTFNSYFHHGFYEKGYRRSWGVVVNVKLVLSVHYNRRSKWRGHIARGQKWENAFSPCAKGLNIIFGRQRITPGTEQTPSRL